MKALALQSAARETSTTPLAVQQKFGEFTEYSGLAQGGLEEFHKQSTVTPWELEPASTHPRVEDVGGIVPTCSKKWHLSRYSRHGCHIHNYKCLSIFTLHPQTEISYSKS